jgi:hypothetical protein
MVSFTRAALIGAWLLASSTSVLAVDYGRTAGTFGKAMELTEIVGRLCRLPIDFYQGSKSMAQLAADSGIGEYPYALTVENAAGYVSAHPEVIEMWLRWSANKRVTSGWYLRRNANQFDVGYFPNGEVFTFSDPAVACAEFVVREVGALIAMSPTNTRI